MRLAAGRRTGFRFATRDGFLAFAGLVFARGGLGDLGEGFCGLLTGAAGDSSVVISTRVSTTAGSCASESFHPRASRTAIIEARMSFQVLASLMTALGNMQPSQQICRNALDGWPASSRSQNPAWWAIVNFPLGSFGRQ